MAIMFFAHMELVRRFNHGDSGAATTIYEEFFGLLYNTARKIPLTHEEAEDLTQDSFLKFLSPRLRFENYKKLKAYLQKIHRNNCVDFLRKVENRQKHFARLQVLGNSFEDLVADAEATAHVQYKISRAIERLPEKYKRLVRLRYIEDLACVEIAAMEKTSLKTVLNNLSVAKKMLGKIGLQMKDNPLPLAIMIYWYAGWLHHLEWLV